MPLYHFVVKLGDGTDGEMADVEFREDATAIDDARPRSPPWRAMPRTRGAALTK
jgi:hypothetical protein